MDILNSRDFISMEITTSNMLLGFLVNSIELPFVVSLMICLYFTPKFAKLKNEICGIGNQCKSKHHESEFYTLPKYLEVVHKKTLISISE